MSLEHNPARAKGSGAAGLNLLKGASAIAEYLGPEFTPRIIRYLHDTEKLTSIFQFGKTGPLCARPDRLDAEIREFERRSATGGSGS